MCIMVYVYLTTLLYTHYYERCLSPVVEVLSFESCHFHGECHDRGHHGREHGEEHAEEEHGGVVVHLGGFVAHLPVEQA